MPNSGANTVGMVRLKCDRGIWRCLFLSRQCAIVGVLLYGLAYFTGCSDGHEFTDLESAFVAGLTTSRSFTAADQEGCWRYVCLSYESSSNSGGVLSEPNSQVSIVGAVSDTCLEGGRYVFNFEVDKTFCPESDEYCTGFWWGFDRSLARVEMDAALFDKLSSGYLLGLVISSDTIVYVSSGQGVVGVRLGSARIGTVESERTILSFGMR